MTHFDAPRPPPPPADFFLPWILRKNKKTNPDRLLHKKTHSPSPLPQIAIAFAAILTFTALLAAALARAHARSAKEGWRANEEKAATTTTAASAAAPPPPSHLSSSSIAAARAVQGQGAPNSTASPNPITATIVARRRLVAACFAAIFAAAAFSVIVACASASGWAVGHMVQLGIESTASGDNRDFANAVGEALAQAQTKLARRMERSTNEAYSTVVNGALGDLCEFEVFFPFFHFGFPRCYFSASLAASLFIFFPTSLDLRGNNLADNTYK